MIDTKTKLVAIIGDPVEHSMSPAIHNAAFNKLGLNYAYLAFNVVDLNGAIAAMRSLGFTGYSVTIPHKQNILKFLDRLDPLAEKIGAVNTVVNRNGELTGYNTDAIGAINALKQKTVLNGKSVSLIGAGGAGHAIAFALQEEGAKTTVFNLTVSQAQLLAKDVGCEYAELSDLANVKSDIIINATPVGMSPKVDSSPVSEEILKKGLIVFDIVYNPLETLLLRQARIAGCETVSGVEMFLGQGAEQFKLWTGKEAPLELMRKTVLEALKK